mmetsp:Transcript_4720/g.13593  ORF Transcript_4720/g.13593 Transcript_4720/m.13593 type:complete len:233 (+) Transcript_4720:89-787(+)
MHFYFRLLLACLVLLCLSGNSIAKHKEEAKEEAKKEQEKNKDKETPPSGKGGPYGIVATAKASNNRSCRATWTCGESNCMGVDDQWLSECKGGKSCKKDLRSWTLTAAKSQWGNTATHYKAVYNIQKPKNCANFVKQNPALVKDLKSCIRSFGRSGSNYKVKFNDLCDVISKVCTVSNYGVKTVGFPQRTMVISVADQNKCKNSGVDSCKSYHRALCINGKVHDGYISTKQH